MSATTCDEPQDPQNNAPIQFIINDKLMNSEEK